VASRLGTAITTASDEPQIDVDYRQIGGDVENGDSIARATIRCEQVAKEVVEFRVRQGRIRAIR
jgi:hypothetical protein